MLHLNLFYAENVKAKTFDVKPGTYSKKNFRLPLVMLLACCSLFAFGRQGNDKNKSDAGKSSKQSSNEQSGSELTPDEKKTAADFKEFLKQKGLGEVKLPGMPALVINPYKVPYNEMDIWIGKQSMENVSDFILLIFNAGKPVTCTFNATENFNEATAAKKECIVIKYNGDHSATYSKVTNNIAELSAHIRVYEAYLKKYELKRRVPYTFKLKKVNADQNIPIHIQATTLKLSSGKSNANSKSKAKTSGSASAGESGDENYVILDCSSGGDDCCQCPPQNS